MEPIDAQTLKPCPYCGEEILSSAQKCKFCKEYLDPVLRKQNAPSDDFLGGSILPTGRPGSAIAAGYLGLIAIIPPFSIFAIIFSLIALRTLKKKPELRGRGRAYFGLVMGVLMTLLWSIPFGLILYELASGRRL